MPRVASILAAALCVAVCVQLASARIQIQQASGLAAPLNIRTPDPCAQDFLFQAAYGTNLLAQSYQACPAGTALPVEGSTIVAPSVVSTANYVSTNTYTVTLTGTNFDDLWNTVGAAGTTIGTVCLAKGTDCTGGCDATLPTRNVVYQSPTIMTFQIQPTPTTSDWQTAALLLEVNPRAICYTNTAAGTRPFAKPAFTGLYYGTVYSCLTNANCGTALRVTSVTGVDLATLSEVDRAIIQGQTTCCAGQCINPNVQGCCGTAGTTYEISRLQCCDGTHGVIQQLNSNCPCRNWFDGSAPICPTNTQCCLPTKFHELVPATFTQIGDCYNPEQQQCCNTGSAFDPGAQQCCSINGVQSAEIACPCETDVDCQGGATQDTTGSPTPNLNQRCCTQTAPAITIGFAEGPLCSPYQNFPSGQTPSRDTRCRGTCFDARFQICCNGATCARQFETCCNATCCNVFTSTCFETGLRAGSQNGLSNNREFGLRFTQCSMTQNLETVSVFWVYVLPAAFLIATLGSLALALVFTAKASVRMFSLLEKMIIAMGIIVTAVSCALFFSPVYKYGIVFAISAIIAIIASAARVRWVTVLALVAVGISCWYLLDPWHGNDYLTLAYWRLSNGQPDPRTAGLFHSLGNLFPYRTQITQVSINQCVIYYNYFILDPLLQDQARYNNPAVTTFGYCTRGWITALLVLAGVLWSSLVFLFTLLVLALILRFRKDRSAPIELEVRPEPFLAPVAPVYAAAPFYAAPTAFVDPYAGAVPFVPAY